jgi:electron transport complex protein RnfG
MAKRESTFINMVLTLFLVTAIASSGLGFIYELTREPIAEAKRIKKLNAIRSTLPAFDNEPSDSARAIYIDGDTVYLYQGFNQEKWIGTAVESFTNLGFSGKIRIMVGFNPDGSIFDISVLEHKETPGLGDKIEKKKSLDKKTGLSWSNQFKGKYPSQNELKVTKDGGEIDAITASTISSRAFCDAVNRAYAAWEQVSAEK